MNRRSFLRGFLGAAAGVAVGNALLGDGVALTSMAHPIGPTIIAPPDFGAIGEMYSKALDESMAQTKETFLARYIHRTYALGFSITDDYTRGNKTVIDSQGLAWRKNAHGHWNILDEEDYDYDTRALIQDQSGIGEEAIIVGFDTGTDYERAERTVHWKPGLNGLIDVRSGLPSILAPSLAYEESDDFSEEYRERFAIRPCDEQTRDYLLGGSCLDADDVVCDNQSSASRIKLERNQARNR